MTKEERRKYQLETIKACFTRSHINNICDHEIFIFYNDISTLITIRDNDECIITTSTNKKGRLLPKTKEKIFTDIDVTFSQIISYCEGLNLLYYFI